MQISFTLRKDKINKNGLIPVRMFISIKGKRIRKNVPHVKTLEKDWKNSDIGFITKKVNRSFRNEVMSNFGNSDLLEWDKAYELKEKYHLSMKDLACFVLQEKIKWFQKLSRFIKS